MVELLDRFGGPVIALHQRFAGAAGLTGGAGFRLHLGLEAKRLSQGGLNVKHQTVFSSFGQAMQPCPNVAEQGLVRFNLLDFVSGGQAFVAQLIPRMPKACGFGNPEHDLQVTQTSG